MRRLLIATLLGAALSTPAFAADVNDTRPAALVIAPATIAAAASSTAANADLATRSDWKYGRPSMLPALYATSAALQGYDAYSTLTALKHGGREANPLMKGIVKSPAAFVAMKAGVTMASIMAAESLWKNNHRFGAIGLMLASNLMMGVVARHNSQVLSTLK
ncbi:MAG: DUF5658 family protein [Vicinamibacterales bacterium]